MRDTDRDAIIAAIMASRTDLTRLAALESRQKRPHDVWRLHAALGALSIALALGERRWLFAVLLRVAWWGGRVLGRSRVKG